MQNSIKALAAYHTFRQLYNNDRNGEIFSLISKFIQYVIYQNDLNNFGVSDIKKKLKDEFDFDFPEAVIKTSLKKIEYISIINHKYVVGKNEYQGQYFGDCFNNGEVLGNGVITLLTNYIRSCGVDLDSNEITKELYNFILNDDRSGKYTHYITTFLLKNKNDKQVHDYIELLSEGCILYTGLNYNSDLSSKKVWSKPITIYLEQEILFYLAGYNGVTFRSIITDFIDLVTDMNNRAQKRGHKRIIQLAYFNDTKQNIENYFAVAREKFDRHESADVDQAAMAFILDGCNEPSDLVNRESDFFNMLEKMGIKEVDLNPIINNSELYKYNAIDIESVDKEVPYRYYNHINAISILRRKNLTRDLKDSSHILLTETRKIITLARESNSRLNNREAIAYLAVTPGLLTNRLWYDLNKGFGGGELPSSLNVWIKAQLVLSTEVDNSFTKKYKSLVNEYKSGKLKKEEVIRYIADLKDKYKAPDDISASNVESVLSFINETSIEDMQARFVKQEKENETLRNDSIKSESELKESKRKLEASNRLIRNAYDKNLILIRRRQNCIKIITNIVWYLSIVIILVLTYIVIYWALESIHYLKELVREEYIEAFNKVVPLIVSLFGIKSTDNYKIKSRIKQYIRAKIVYFFDKHGFCELKKETKELRKQLR